MQTPSSTDELKSIAATEFRWDAAGSSESHRYLAAPVVRYLRASGAKNVLDLGCGNGNFTAFLAAQGFTMQGCDGSSSGLAIARAASPSIPFFQHDFAAPLADSYREKYDAVVSMEVIEHLLLPRMLMKSAYEALLPGGTFVLSTPYHGYLKNLLLALTNQFDDHWHPLRDFGHIKFFSCNTLLALLEECGFEVVSYTRAGRIPPLACSMVVAGRKK
ncbi:MAG: class I SAM-dependent methyltransferase [Acidobacteriota bacterium]|nr:class I SAM-dependent methyltransferase [Acidobacteriota bacterium]